MPDILEIFWDDLTDKAKARILNGNSIEDFKEALCIAFHDDDFDNIEFDLETESIGMIPLNEEEW